MHAGEHADAPRQRCVENSEGRGGSWVHRPGHGAHRYATIVTVETPSYVKNAQLRTWVAEMVDLCKPTDVRWCDGSDEEYDELCEQLVQAGTFIRLDEEKRPNSFLARSDASDVARVEDRTFICSRAPQDAGPTNNWMDPREMHDILDGLFDGCMRGRTMYVVPFSMGPLGSDIAQIGVEISDSPYVVVNMKIMTRMGRAVHDVLGEDGPSCRACTPWVRPSSRARPTSRGRATPTKYIVHFPEERAIWSYGSGYGGNALLGKKCLALRIASTMAREEGWLAEHMLILGVTDPGGDKTYVAAAFPSQCGKTNFAMLVPPASIAEKGWKVTTVGDDIAWIKPGADGRLYAINPEAGYFGVAPGTSDVDQPGGDGVDPCQHHLHQRRAHRRRGRVVGGPRRRAARPRHRLAGQRLDARRRPGGPPQRAVHRAGRSEPGHRPRVGRPCRRARSVHSSSAVADRARSRSWSSRSTGPTGVRRGHDGLGDHRRGVRPAGRGTPRPVRDAAVRRVPHGQLHQPLAGDRPHDPQPATDLLGELVPSHADGGFAWPGFGENMRVLQWIVERSNGKAVGIESPLGWMPRYQDLDWDGLESFTESQFLECMSVDRSDWHAELLECEDLFMKLHERLPTEMRSIRDLVTSALWRSPGHWEMNADLT
jgi:phosphoenolpyruvate carboxykinase (GTP)